MMHPTLRQCLCCWMASAAFAVASTPVYVPTQVAPPDPLREFRGLWVASVGNINWPSKPGLSSQDQKRELLGLMDRMVELKMNAVIFQVRPACDALYISQLEPWSEYLSGQMGHAPKPAYDPLEFAVEEAHKRGLEIHAWFNPFRARYWKAISAISPTHISRTHPHLVKNYGQYLWLDPGQQAVHDLSLKVVLDVVRRYEIDGVHLDDYFYPYPEKDRQGRVVDFPDNSSWMNYVGSGGKLNRSDWRRQNVNQFLASLYRAIKQEKPHVKFGVSPFGIWRPGHPAQVRGLDAFELLYADARKWLLEGHLDYFAPQLYWSTDAKEQSFPALLKWWTDHNPTRRHLWPGVSLLGPDGKRMPAEVLRQVAVTRQQPGVSGHVLWSAKPLMSNTRGLGDMLRTEAYASSALTPAFAWLDKTPPGAVQLRPSAQSVGIKLNWKSDGPEKPWLWLLQTKTDGRWSQTVLPGRETALRLSSSEPDVIAIRQVDRCGNTGPATVLEKTKT